MILHRAPGLLRAKYLIPRAGTGAYASIYRPVTALDWTSLASGIVAPRWAWLMQDASGGLVASITPGGTSTLVANSGTMNYAQTVTNWTTNWVQTTAVASSGWFLGAADLWTAGSESVFGLWYANFPAAPGSQSNVGTYGHNALDVRLNSSGVMSARVGASSASGSYNYADSAAHPIGFAYDRRGGGAARCNTDKELLSPTYESVGNGSKAVGVHNSSVPAGAKFNLWAVWRGTDAETMMDRGGANLGMKTLLQNLGWALAY